MATLQSRATEVEEEGRREGVGVVAWGMDMDTGGMGVVARRMRGMEGMRGGIDRGGGLGRLGGIQMLGYEIPYTAL